MSLVSTKLNWIKKIERIRGPQISRYHFLRLDKNEKIDIFKKKFFLKVIKKINSNHLTAYPEVENLYKLISNNNKINIENLVLTSGSDQAIKHCFELFVKKNSKIITLNPTFAMVDIYSKLFQAKQIKIGYNKKLEINQTKLNFAIKKNISLIIIANPNSPTGTILNLNQLKQIILKASKLNVPVLIDEAYHGFSKISCISLIKKFKNLIVTRTFSKSFGLAGLRVGYIAANKKIADLLYRFKPMYEVNSLALLFAEEAFKNKIDKKYSEETNSGKKLIIKTLEKLKIHYFDTYANFIHIDFKKNKKTALEYFKKNKILVKGGPGVNGTENYLRITLGPKKYMKKVISIIKKTNLS